MLEKGKIIKENLRLKIIRLVSSWVRGGGGAGPRIPVWHWNRGISQKTGVELTSDDPFLFFIRRHL